MRRPYLALAALVLVVVGLAFPAVRHLREQPPPPPPSVRLTFAAPSGTELGSGDEVLDAAISPDERRIVFVATGAGTTALWQRALETDRAEVLRGTEGAHLPAWTPSGDAVLFFAGGRLRAVSLADGTVKDLAEAPSPAGATRLRDGSTLFAPQSTGVIRRLSEGAVSDATRLRPGDRAHVFPSATDADDLVYTAVGNDGRRTIRLVQNGEERDLITTSGHGQIVGDYLLFVRDEVLLAQRIDGSSGAPQGRAVPVSSQVGVTPAGRNLFVASRRLLVSAASSSRAREVAWFDLTGRRTGTSGDAGEFWQVRLSPDDQYAAVTSVAPLLRTLDISIVPTDPGKEVEPLTLALAADSDPVWAPDGRRVAFRSLQKGRPALFARQAHDTNAEDDVLLDVEFDATPSDWRGSGLLFQAPDPASGYDIWTFDPRNQSRTPAVKTGFNDTDGRVSPDGGWLAYVSDESGRPDIYAQAWPDGMRERVSSAGGTRPRWSRDGGSLFFLRDSTIMRATRQEGARFDTAVAVLSVSGIRDFDLAHRRDALVALVPVTTASAAPVSVLVDWQSTLAAFPAVRTD